MSSRCRAHHAQHFLILNIAAWSASLPFPVTFTVHPCSPAVHETIRVKSAAWDDNGVLVYTTLNHIKYCLPNGDSGIIRTLDVPVYITRVAGSMLHCLDREGKVRQIQVRPS